MRRDLNCSVLVGLVVVVGSSAARVLGDGPLTVGRRRSRGRRGRLSMPDDGAISAGGKRSRRRGGRGGGGWVVRVVMVMALVML